jgi:hypothetical protein
MRGVQHSESIQRWDHANRTGYNDTNEARGGLQDAKLHLRNARAELNWVIQFKSDDVPKGNWKTNDGMYVRVKDDLSVELSETPYTQDRVSEHRKYLQFCNLHIQCFETVEELVNGNDNEFITQESTHTMYVKYVVGQPGIRQENIYWFKWND